MAIHPRLFRREAGPPARHRGVRSRRPLLLTIGAVTAVAVVAGGLVAAGVVGHGSVADASNAVAPVSTKGFPAGPGVTGIFTDRCTYSHEAADDPIMYPGQAGASMHHDFFGNTGTTASSTAAGLVGGPTTCTTSADSSAYWAPVLYQNGRALTPEPALIYWRRPPQDSGSMQTIPVGLQIIAGNEAATTPQSTSIISWGCQTASVRAVRAGGTAMPHSCAAGSGIRLTVFFPSCWDGRTLAGMGQTDVVYPVAGVCPTSNPVQIPQIVFHVAYPTSSPAALTLSTSPIAQGSINSAHIDFVNGWNQSRLNADVDACDATSTQCGPVTGALATPHGPSKAVVRAEARRRRLRRHRQRLMRKVEPSPTAAAQPA